MGHPRRKTLEGKGPVSSPVAEISALWHRGSVASRPHQPDPCSPASRSNTCSRCSSCRCYTRNSSSQCFTTAVMLMPMRTEVVVVVVEEVDTTLVIPGHRGIQKVQDIQTAMLELNRTINRTRRPEVPLHLRRVSHSLLHCHRNRIPTTANRYPPLQNLRRLSHRRTSLLPKKKRSITKTHPHQRTTTPYNCRSNSNVGTNSIFRIYKS